jgi:coproporphyrinogen III oxidase-like Fe-S oxidoreductase
MNKKILGELSQRFEKHEVDYIIGLLQQKDQELIKKIEEMKTTGYAPDGIDRYNQALDDIINLIKNQ